MVSGSEALSLLTQSEMVRLLFLYSTIKDSKVGLNQFQPIPRGVTVCDQQRAKKKTLEIMKTKVVKSVEHAEYNLYTTWVL